MNLFRAGLPTLLLVSACGTPQAEKKPFVPFTALYAEPNTKAHIFLVAGSNESANFAQEVVDQRNFWTSHGYREEEVECFYVPPDEDSDDLDHFERLREDLAHCNLAGVKYLKTWVENLATSGQPSLYFYLTSHGSQSVNVELQSITKPAVLAKFQNIVPISDWVNSYSISVDAMPMEDGYEVWSSSKKTLTLAERYAGHAADFLFSPESFSATLNTLPSAMKKFVGLSACFSGSFVSPHIPNNLRSVSNLTALTAADYDRTSFGCGTNENKTFYDEAYFSSLQASGASRYDQVDWKTLNDVIVQKVRTKETQVKIAPNKFSNPQFLVN